MSCGCAAKNRAGFGDAGNPELRSAIRAHAHFAEYVPIVTLMVAMLEMSGLPSYRVHFLMAALLVSRLLHPLRHAWKVRKPAVSYRPGGGMILTEVVMIASAMLILLQMARGPRARRGL